MKQLVVWLKQTKINIWNWALKAIFYFYEVFFDKKYSKSFPHKYLRHVVFRSSPPRNSFFPDPLPLFKIWDWKLSNTVLEIKTLFIMITDTRVNIFLKKTLIFQVWNKLTTGWQTERNVFCHKKNISKLLRAWWLTLHMYNVLSHLQFLQFSKVDKIMTWVKYRHSMLQGEIPNKVTLDIYFTDEAMNYKNTL